MRLLLLVIGLMSMVACRKSPEQSIEIPEHLNSSNKELYIEVVAIHDEVMPRMTDIYRLRKALIKSQAEPDSTTLVLITQLRHADDEMMTWMAEYIVPKDLDPTGQKSFLLKEKDKIEAVSQAMLSAIANAESHLNTEK